jgi:hypothetical protein
MGDRARDRVRKRDEWDRGLIKEIRRDTWIDKRGLYTNKGMNREENRRGIECWIEGGRDGGGREGGIQLINVWI